MDKYRNIINIPHFEPKYHKRMRIEARAAQFAPFSALTGYSELINESSRLTENKIILEEDIKEILDRKLHNTKNNRVAVYYFIPDNKKSGGSYEEYSGSIKKIDTIKNIIIFNDKKEININNIIDINILKEE